MIEVGQDAPDFTLPGVENGAKRDYTLSEYRGRKVVIAFYPGDNTPGCTRQMCSYRDNLADLEATGAVLLGISPQDVDSHESWAEKKGFTFPLLADVDKTAIEAYGVGAPLIGVRRSVFVVDPAGKVAFADRKLIGATFVRIDKLVPILEKV
jgi:peroxiredoxin Q/BCP